MSYDSGLKQELNILIGRDYMRIYLLIVLVCAFGLLGACTSQGPAQPAQPAAGELPFKTTATIKDLMDGIIDPSADVIWESVATIVSAEGIEERVPRTDEEWANVRRSAIRLLEATNSLMIPRRVAKPGEKADDPQIELTPERIEQTLNADRASWNKHALELHDSTLVAFEAIEKKDAEGLLLSGEAIDVACENCHLQYWYPDDAARQNAQQQGLSQTK